MFIAVISRFGGVLLFCSFRWWECDFLSVLRPCLVTPEVDYCANFILVDIGAMHALGPRGTGSQEQHISLAE